MQRYTRFHAALWAFVLVLTPSQLVGATPLCRSPVARAVWLDTTQGARLRVNPSACGRRTAWLAPRSAFRAALALGGRPVARRRTLYAQFRCHAVFAPAKTSWNLETWRPVVTPGRMVAALCNPSGRASPRPRRPPGRLSLLARVAAAARLAFRPA